MTPLFFILATTLPILFGIVTVNACGQQNATETAPRSQADCAAGEIYRPPPPCGIATCVTEDELQQLKEMIGE
jgi:hypothetical protein